jgi:hypothetical protein
MGRVHPTPHPAWSALCTSAGTIHRRAFLKKIPEAYRVSVAEGGVQTVTLHYARRSLRHCQSRRPPCRRTAPIVDTSAAPRGRPAQAPHAALPGRLPSRSVRPRERHHPPAGRPRTTPLTTGWSLNTQIHALENEVPWIAEQARIPFGAQGRYTFDLSNVGAYLVDAAPDPVHAKRQILANVDTNNCQSITLLPLPRSTPAFKGKRSPRRPAVDPAGVE